MGRGIGQLALNHGFDVVLYDVDASRAEAAADRLRLRWHPENVVGSEGEGEAPEVSVSESVEDAVKDADVVIESVPERVALKAQVLQAIAGAAPKNCLLSTNTSTLSIGLLARAGGCEGRLIGMHFFNPPEKMRLVEVIRAPGVSESQVDRTEQFARSLGKSPIVIEDSPGFVTSRLGLVLGNEAMRLAESRVASVSSIDAAMRLGYNHPMGPLELVDLVGLDARLNNLRSIHDALQDCRFEPPQILIDLVESDYLGRKTGRGFYFYDDEGHQLGDAVGILVDPK
jgi:3-hydroxybutyryl-CoA dehydrogenase